MGRSVWQAVSSDICVKLRGDATGIHGEPEIAKRGAKILEGGYPFPQRNLN
jgi:hypothetical protein